MNKSGIDYFPLDVHLDDKFKLIEAEFGLTGFAVIVKLYQRIYGERGYYCEWTNEVALLFAREVGVGGNVVSQIVSAAVKRGIFDKDMYDKYGILTSKGIQSRYFEAVSRRVNVSVENAYLLVCHAPARKSVNISGKNVCRNEENADSFEQIRVDKIRVNKSIEEGIYNTQAPPLKKVIEYIEEKKLNVSAEAFYNYYQERGWKINGKSMIPHWKERCENWSKTEHKAKKKESSMTDDFFDAAVARAYKGVELCHEDT